MERHDPVVADTARHYSQQGAVEATAAWIDSEVERLVEEMLGERQYISEAGSNFGQAEWDLHDHLMALLCSTAEVDDKLAAIDRMTALYKSAITGMAKARMQ